MLRTLPLVYPMMMILRIPFGANWKRLQPKPPPLT
jgi:hypothetical protein